MPKPASPPSRFGLNLLRAILSRNTKYLLEQLSGLDGTQRQALAGELDSTLKVIHKVCLPPRTVDSGQCLRAADEFALRLAASDALEPALEILKQRIELIHQRKPPGEVFGLNPPTAGQVNAMATESASSPIGVLSLDSVYRRLQAFRIATGNQKTVMAALKYRGQGASWLWGNRFSRDPERRFEWYAWVSARVLLDRPEEWKKAIFLEWCEHIERWVGFFSTQGFSLAIEAALKEHPDWYDDLHPYFGKAMVLDGFSLPDWHVRFDGKMVLAGLQTEVTDNGPGTRGRQFTHSFANAGQGGILDYVLLMPKATRPAREELLSLALNSLTATADDFIAKQWADFLVKLSPTREEVAEHASAFLNLTGATTLTAINLGLGFCEKSWEAKTLAPDELINVLVIPLTQRNQTIGLRAWKLAAAIAASTPEHFDNVAQVAFDCLTSPHRKLRETTAKWLAKHAKSFSVEAQDMLKTLFPLLGPAEQSVLSSIVQVEAQVTPTSGQVDDFAHRIATFTDHIENLPARQRARLHVVQQWLVTGVVSKLEPMPPTFEASLVRDVVPFQSPEEIATAFIEALARPLTQLDFELLLDGIRRFPDGGDETSIQKTLDPLHQIYVEFFQGGGSVSLKLLGQLRERYVSAIEAALLVELWLRAGQRNIPLDPKRPLTWRKRVDHVASFMKRGEVAPIVALPTSRVGWIHPEDFAHRILETMSLDAIDLDDLAVALYRLAPVLEARGAAWLKLESKLDESPQADAIRIALAPEFQSRGATTRLDQRLASEPIKDALFRNPDLQKRQETVEAFRQTGSCLFRLRVAAERSRNGFEASNSTLPEVSHNQGFFWNVTASGENSSQVGKYAIVEKVVHKLKWKVLFPALFNPVQITDSTLTGIGKEERIPFAYTITEYPVLSPYLASTSRDFWKNFGEIDEWENIRNQICNWPLGAQRFFEAGDLMCRTPLTKQNNQERSLALAIPLARAGQFENVQIHSHISSIVFGGLKSFFREDNEPFVNLLTGWLHDGRATPDDIMSALANGVLSEEVKFANFERAIVSLMAASPAGSLTIIGAIEQALAGEFQKTTPRKQSQLLERLELLLAETGRVVESSAARDKLAILAAGKSAAGEKARRLLSATVPPNQQPLTVAIASALLDS